MKIIPHNPPKLPIKLDYSQFANELAEASYNLGLLEGAQKKLQNPGLLIAPLTAKEAAVSSKIEGTQSTASDVFIFDASGKMKQDDTAEVANYRNAMLYATGELRLGKKLTAGLIKTTHALLLKEVRHKGLIGEFRNRPVWIAEKIDDPIEIAKYIPPESITIPEHIESILEYVESSNDLPLIKAGMVHYQFEAVHPFEDGNGRIGRLLVPLLLFYRKRLTLPILYLSGYFESNKEQYIGKLRSVDTNQNYEDWMKFFLHAVSVQAIESQSLIDNIDSLHNELRQAFQKVKSPYMIPTIECMFKSPVFTIRMLEKETGATRLTCTNLLRDLRSREFVVELDFRAGRMKLFAFTKLLSIIR